MSKDYYKVLGIEKTATHDDVKKAFRKLAHQYHPDKASGNEAKFKEINEAYQVVGNEEKRKQYDQHGADFEQQGGFGGGMGWEDFMRQARQQQQGGGGFSQGGINFDMGDIGDMFGDLFGFSARGSPRWSESEAGGSGGRRRVQGADIEVKVDLDFKEAVFGVDKELEVYKTSSCKHCHGSGAEPGSSLKKCNTCGGNGVVEQIQRTILGAMRARGVCPDCRGAGTKPDKTCSDCTGTGVRRQTAKFHVKIPAGIDDNQMIRLDGEGETAAYGGATGDLYVRVRVRSPKGFVRQKQDILTEVTISFAQAALGTHVDIETIEGNVELKIPAGMQSGKVLKLKGRGIPHLGSSDRGDQLVTVLVKTPGKLSKKEKKLYQDLAALHDERVDNGGGLFG